MKIIIPIIVGAAIGYFTNWLAIKMLFRPLEEKRIFGIKVPFTPGLIPKERKRMANSIGEAVGMHLLTPEKITEVISSDETKLKLRVFINSKLESLKNSDRTFKEALSSIESKDNHLILVNIKEKIFKSIMSGLKDEELKRNLIKFIEEDVYEKHKGKALDIILDQGDKMLEEMKGSERLKELFIELVDVKIKEISQEDRILKDIIPEKFIDKLNLSIDENKEAIVDRLRELFYKPSIQTSIKLSIEELVEQNVSKMITMFLEPSIISEKVFSAISKYVDSTQAEEVTSFILKDSIDNIANSKVSYASEYMSKLIGEEDRENLYQKLIANLLSGENKKNLLIMLRENAELKDDKIKSSIIKNLEIGMDDILNSENFKLVVKKLIDSNINKAMGLSISQTFNKIDDKEVEVLLDTFDNIFNTLLKDELYNVIKLFNVSQIVEDEINSFDVEYTEKLILDIADRELKAITRLGALLGAVMGLLMPLLQMI